MAGSAEYLERYNWRQLRTDPYRCVKLYDSLLWTKSITSLEDFTVCAAPYGGPIAVTNRAAHFSVFRSTGVGAADTVSIFSASGAILGHAALQKHAGPVVAMGWTATERLAIVFEDGAVDVYDVRGELTPKSFNLLSGLGGSAGSGGGGGGRERVDLVALCPTGMAAVTRSADGRRYSLYLVYDWENPSPVVGNAGPTLPTSVRPTCLAAIDGAVTSDGQMEVLLGTPDRSIVVVDSGLASGSGDDDGYGGGSAGGGGGGAASALGGGGGSGGGGVDQLLGDALATVAVVITPSPSGRYLAILCEDGSIVVMDSLFERKLVEVSSTITTQPTQVVWCGDDSVVLTWPDTGTLLFAGPYGDTLTWEYDPAGGMHVVSEVDCVRVITATSHEMVQKVPDTLRGVRSIGTTSAAAALLLAAAKFSEDSADCDDMVRALIAEGSLRDAVAHCMAAAMEEWQPAHQRTLLQAASYGKSFEPAEVDAGAFVAACKKLRVLNACRSHEAGIPLSSSQLDALTPPVVVDRLCMRHNYRMALSICSYLGFSADRVLVHWACTKVRVSPLESDEAVRDAIRRKLAGVAGVSYADIAATADSAGRRRLATMLLDFEPRAADQVPILLKMREGTLALVKALDSGDTDLVYLALLHLRRHAGVMGDASHGASGGSGASSSDPDSPEAEESFLRLVLAYPAAIDLLAAYYRAHNVDPTLLVKLYFSAGRYCDAGHLLLHVGYRAESVEGRVRFFRRAGDAFKEGEKSARSTAAEKASCAFYRSCVEDEIALLGQQVELERAFETAGSDDATFVDTSLTDTIFKLTLAGDAKRAAALKDAFKLPDATFWHVKVRALAKARDWKALEKFADEKRSPIGFRPFVDACIEFDGTIEGRKYAMRITDPNEKIDALIACAAYVDAAEVAFKQRDLDRLDEIGSLAKTPAAIEAVEKARLALTGSKR